MLKVFEVSINILCRCSLSNSFHVWVVKTTYHDLCFALTLITNNILILILKALLITFGAKVIHLYLFLIIKL